MPNAMGEDVVAEQRVRAQQGVLVRLLTSERLDLLPLAEAYARLTRSVAEVIGVERASIWDLDEAAGRLHCRHLHFHGSDSHSSGEMLRAEDYPVYFRTLASSRAIAAHDARNDPATREFASGYLQPLGISSMLDATVRRGGHTVGIVCLEHVGPARRWSLDEQQFCATVADIVLMLQESQERRELQERLYQQMRHDALTGLPNLTRLREELGATDLQHCGPHALMLLDLERFGEINHSLGHRTGDQVLCAIASRLTTDLPPGAQVARLSGDKFALWLPLRDGTDPLALARSIQTRLREPIDIGAGRLAVTARFGISLCPDHGSDGHELLLRADMAMHDAKGTLHGCQLYDPVRDRSSARRLGLIHDLRGADQRSELFAVFQPRVSLPEGRILGVEALLRWRHPQLGNVSPGEFIPLAEMSDLIVDLTLAVLRLSGTAWHSWSKAGHELGLSINLSARAIGDRGFTEVVLRQLAESGVPPRHVEFEITESAICDETDQGLETLRLIRDAGARISLDDFGVGHSSMARLSRLPVDVMKIDQMFVRDMLRDPRHAAIVRTSIDLAHSMGLSAVAEGVETAEVAAALARLGCDEAQGYHYGATLLPEELARLLGAGGTAH